MRDRWIPDSSRFHKPSDEDSANEDALFVCGIFFMGIKNGELFMEETKKRSMGDPHMAVPSMHDLPSTAWKNLASNK